MLVQYAWKGFLRRRTRSLLAVLGIALSIGLLVAVVTISRSVEQAVASSLDAAGADMVIQKRVEACPFSYIKLPKDLAAIGMDVVSKLNDHPDVDIASGVLELWAFSEKEGAPADGSEAGGDMGAAAPGDGDKPLPILPGADKPLQPTVVAGIDPSTRTIGPVRIASREEVGEDETCCAVAEGRYLVPTDDYHVMITQAYAEAKGLAVGEFMPLGLDHKFEIVAILDISGAARIAGAEAFVPLKTAQGLYGQGEVVDTIFVSLKHARSSQKVAAFAAELIGKDVSITTNSNVDAGTLTLASVTRNSLLAISGFVLAFALLLLVRNALDNVAQRVDEVGLMKAIGWRNADVARLFAVEAAYAGVIGGLIGSLLGSAGGWVYGKVAHLELPASLNAFPPCSATEAPLALPLSTDPSMGVFALGLALALAIGMIAGLAASVRAARLDPAEALRRL